MSNSVRLSTRTVSGLRADLLWAAGDERDSPPDRKRNRAFDGALFYESGPFAASFAWRKIELSGALVSGDGREQRNLLAGASYDWQTLKLFAQYQGSKDSFATLAPDTDRRTWQLGAAVPWGAGKVLVSWAHSKRDGASTATSAKRATWAIGYDHDLSKRTDLYAMYYRDSLEDPLGPKEQILALGIRHRF
jgi:predicted porin